MTLTAFSQNYYRSKKNGAYNASSTWESSIDSSTWITSTNFPNGITKNVVIQSGHIITPTTSSTINVKNLTINGSLTLGLGIGTPKSFIINGEFINNGTFNHNYSSVIFSGSTNNISGSSTSTFYILKIDKSTNNTVNVTSNIELIELLTFGTLATNTLNVSTGSFKFLSNTTATAHIDILSSPLPVMLGNYTIQRFFPAQNGRYLFMIGVPISNSTVSMLQPTTFDGSGYPTNGIYITGMFTGTNTGSGMTTNPSGAKYNPNTGLYYPYPTSSNTETLNQGEGYRFSVRDGGSSVLTTVEKILTVTGNPYVGDFTFQNLVNGIGTKPFASGTLTGINAPITGGWNLISNPYVSDISIDLTSNWTLSNVSQTAYIYDAATRNFLPCASGVPSENCIVSSFQGIWIQANGTNPSLTINEGAKISDQNTLNNLRIAQKNKLNYFGIKLSNSTSSNKTYIRYKDGSSLKNDNFDGYKLGVNNDSSITQIAVYTKYDSIYYDVNSKPLNFVTDTTELYVIASLGTNRLDFTDVNNLENGYDINLYDKYTKTLTNVSTNSIYDFTINTDSTSYRNRFQVIVNNKTTSIIDNKLSNDISVYPNPFINKINIHTTSNENFNVVITDILGKDVYKGNNTKHINTNNLNSGVYFVKVSYNDKTYTEKLIKE